MHMKIVILVKASFFLKKNSAIWFNCKSQTQKKYSVFRKDILSKASILMKLTKNLVIIASSLWTK